MIDITVFIAHYSQKLIYGKETPKSMQRDTVSLEQVGHHCSSISLGLMVWASVWAYMSTDIIRVVLNSQTIGIQFNSLRNCIRHESSENV